MFRMIRVRKHEVGLWFRHGDFKYALHPGAYLVPTRLFGDYVEVFSKLLTRFEHPMLDALVNEDQLKEHLLVVDLKDNQRALVWKDGRLGWMLGPGRHAFWNAPAKLKVEVFNVDDFKFEHAKIEAILAQKQAEANLIRRRQETAAARSQGDSAKLLAENPVLARMKELEALQEILKGAKTTFVLGQGDIAQQVRGLVSKDAINQDTSGN